MVSPSWSLPHFLFGQPNMVRADSEEPPKEYKYDSNANNPYLAQQLSYRIRGGEESSQPNDGGIPNDTDDEIRLALGDDGDTISITSSQPQDSQRRLTDWDGDGTLVSTGDPALVGASSKFQVAMANKYSTLEDSVHHMSRFRKAADARIQRSYLSGQPVEEGVHPDAVFLRVGLKFLPGADLPSVARSEQEDMNKKESPDQKDATWRFQTAPSLLQDFNVTKNLEWEEIDRTAEIASSARESQKAREDGVAWGRIRPDFRARNKSSKAKDNASEHYNSVTIDSDCVKIVHDLRGGMIPWDVQATLIEVDQGALISLISHYKHIIAQGRPDASLEETSNLLSIMIEDARRLVVRSPILFRMSTRIHIMHSKDTRYGIDHGRMFRTVTTSKGIKEIISISASYFNSLDPSGSSDRTQNSIRPRFLQMVILLLSFLNNDDLADIQDFLESTYHLKANRQHLERVFLKVIPLMSINPKIFMNALVLTIDNIPLPEEQPGSSSARSERRLQDYWGTFTERCLAEGYIIPGTVHSLGSDPCSWIVKWPRDGIKSCDVFNHLQYRKADCSLRAVNGIEPLQLHPETSFDRITAYLNNDRQFTIHSKDVERITLLTPGTYPIQEARDGGAHTYDLIITQTSLSGPINQALEYLNGCISKYNKWLESSRGDGGLMYTNTVTKWVSKAPQKFPTMQPLLSHGRLSKAVAHLNGDTLAKAYKLEGKKIPKVDCTHYIAGDVNRIRDRVSEISRRLEDVRLGGSQKKELKEILDQIRQLLMNADKHRADIDDEPELSDEPIAKLLFPQETRDQGDRRHRDVWFDYNVWYTQSDGQLKFEARSSPVVRVQWLNREFDLVEIVLHRPLHNQPVTYHATPLHKVLESEKDDEVQVGDLAVLAGKYIIIATDSDYAPTLKYMTNYLRIVAADPHGKQSARGANRRQARSGEDMSQIAFV